MAVCVHTIFQVRKGGPERLGGRVFRSQECDQCGQRTEDHEGVVAEEGTVHHRICHTFCLDSRVRNTFYIPY